MHALSCILAGGVRFLPQFAAWLTAMLPPARLGVAIFCAIHAAGFHLYGAEPTLRIGFSMGTLGSINENDAMAAVRIWSKELAREMEIAIDPQPLLFHDSSETYLALEKRVVDCINLPTLEYLTFRNFLATDRLIAASNAGKVTEEYVLVVNKKSGIQKLADLRGHSLLFQEKLRHGLSMVWLDTRLAEDRLGKTANFFRNISSTAKVDKAILRVFFRQIDCCLVSRRALETMVELNSQIGQQLTVLIGSPPLVPEVFCFRKDYAKPVRDKILQRLSSWHLSPPGRQILTIFQTESLQEISEGSLHAVMQLVDNCTRLLGKTPNDLLVRSVTGQ
jgi:ABC-type phosphate/phosphonate transport system substrate-binding protein